MVLLLLLKLALLLLLLLAHAAVRAKETGHAEKKGQTTIEIGRRHRGRPNFSRIGRVLKAVLPKM